MKAIFGVLSLLIVLAIVGTLAGKHLQAVAVAPTTTGATAGDASSATLPQQSRKPQRQVADATARALQQGMQRNERADR